MLLLAEDNSGTSDDAQSREATREAQVAQEADDVVAQWHAGGGSVAAGQAHRRSTIQG
eukprot:SAG22_NODE_820_length_7011_cov_2.073640_3_plen_58_part_00